MPCGICGWMNCKHSRRSFTPTVVNDPVNHPSHYTSHPSGVECIDITEHMSFNIGNAMKYLWRAGLKDTTSQSQDLDKAMWYIRREIDRQKRLYDFQPGTTRKVDGYTIIDEAGSETT